MYLENIKYYSCKEVEDDYLEVDTNIWNDNKDIWFSIYNFENGEEKNTSVRLTRKQIADLIVDLQKELVK